MQHTGICRLKERSANGLDALYCTCQKKCAAQVQQQVIENPRKHCRLDTIGFGLSARNPMRNPATPCPTWRQRTVFRCGKVRFRHSTPGIRKSTKAFKQAFAASRTGRNRLSGFKSFGHYSFPCPQLGYTLRDGHLAKIGAVQMKLRRRQERSLLRRVFRRGRSRPCRRRTGRPGH